VSIFITERGGKSFLDVKRRDGGSINNSVQRNKALRSLVDLRFDYKSDGMESVLRYGGLYYKDLNIIFVG